MSTFIDFERAYDNMWKTGAAYCIPELDIKYIATLSDN